MVAPSGTVTGTVLHVSSSIAAGASAVDTLDVSSKFGAWLTVKVTFGTVAATAGLQIDVFPRYDSTPTFGTRSNFTYVIPSTASSTQYSIAIWVDWGIWQIRLLNLDATNAVTAVESKVSTLDAIV